jgi:glycosyltransferase involved in cell wall biosynthesis
MKLSLIINTHDQPAALGKVLRGVNLQTRLPDEVLIADDGSEEPTRRLIEEWRRKAKTPVQHVWHAHEGFRRTVILNKAINAAHNDYLVFLDGDCVPHRDFVGDHLRLAEKGFWVQGRRCFVKKPFVADFEAERTPVWQWLLAGRISGVFKGIHLPVPLVRRGTQQRGIIGCNMAFWRDDLVAVNGFDESFTGWGGEDSDLGSRLYHLGRPRKFVHGHAIVFHLNHPAVSRDRASDNFARLAETLRSRKIRCEQGLAQHGTRLEQLATGDTQHA